MAELPLPTLDPSCSAGFTLEHAENFDLWGRVLELEVVRDTVVRLVALA